MGEWSEYFEDFPEENPANCVNGQYKPEAAKRLQAIDANNLRVRQESQALQRKMFEMAESAQRAAVEQTLK